jgi:cation:H+ antiporter
MIELILVAFFLLLVGIFLIDIGSDYSAKSLSAVAKKLGTTKIAIGLTLVSIVVSLPEILVVIYTQLNGYVNIGLGTIIGSIMANIGLMAGLVAMFKPIKTDRGTIFRDGIFALFVAIIVFVLGFDGNVSGTDGTVLLLMFIPYLLNVWNEERMKSKLVKEEELKEVELELKAIGIVFGKIKAGMFSFIFGISVLLFGAYVFSEALVSIAKNSGISEIVIGLTFGAIGTSIPNFASAFKAHYEEYEGVALSETLGSNVFTLLVTLGIMGLLNGVAVANSWIIFDIPAMIIMSAALIIFMGTKNSISRFEGSILFLSYIIFLSIQILLNSI